MSKKHLSSSGENGKDKPFDYGSSRKGKYLRKFDLRGTLNRCHFPLEGLKDALCHCRKKKILAMMGFPGESSNNIVSLWYRLKYRNFRALVPG